MNPGPAPRPPIDRTQTDRSRTPVGTNYPQPGFASNNYSTTSLTSPSLQSARTWSSAGSSTSGISRTNTIDPLQAAGAIKAGWIKYKEDGFGGFIWKTKWVVLRQNTIDFHKAEGGKISFTIILAHVTGVQRWDAIPMCIELVRAANPAAHPGVPLRDQPQKAMYMRFDGDEDLYEWQDGIYTRCPAISGVSNPTNFSHRVHVGFDPTTGGFLGLPPEWEKLLTTSAITKDDYLKNPQAVIEVLEFYTDINKRAENPDTYPHLMPTPPAHTSQNMQLGHGGGGTSIAPPRPGPPGERSMSFSSQQQQRSVTQPGRPPGPTSSMSQQQQQRNFSGPPGFTQQQSPPGSQSGASDGKLGMGAEMRRIMDEEAKKIKDQQEAQQRGNQRRRDDEERERREREEYNASLPQKKMPMAKTEVGGYGGSPAPDPSRFNPTRAAPAAPGSDRARQQQQQQQGQGLNARIPPMRQGPQDGSSGSPAPPRAPYGQTDRARNQSPSSSSLRTRDPRKDPQARQPSPASRPPVKPSGDRNQSPASRAPGAGGANGAAPPTRLPGPVNAVKPLNVSKANGAAPHPQPKADPAAMAAAQKDANAKAGDAGAGAAGAARGKEARMSSMTESEVMAKLKRIVTKLEPGDSYVKQKKIGQGASGSVYIAKVRGDASSPVARTLYRKDGGDARVAIKTMDLKHQPRKELIVNEIIVMKESAHPNIVNYLDSFLIENDSELWVIMEYMNGGALTDVIENNPAITEDQIAAICNEVCTSSA